MPWVVCDFKCETDSISFYKNPILLLLQREGFSRFNKIYEYDYLLLNQNCSMVMTSVSGHLLGLEFVGQYRKW